MSPKLSPRKMRWILWVSVVLTTIYLIAFGVFMHMIPPPDPGWSAERVAEFYRDNSLSIRIGAVISSWVSGFSIPYGVVVAAQIARQETGRKVWAALALASGALTSVFFALPPIAWGTAAYTPERSPDVTQMMHQFGCFASITTDQLYLGMWVAVAVICFTPHKVKHSPFPRWWGYATIWSIMMLEPGALAFLPHGGIFGWNGLMPFWSPAVSFVTWMLVQAILIFRALKGQEEEDNESRQTLLEQLESTSGEGHVGV